MSSTALRSICFVRPSSGNGFFDEIMAALADAIAGAGVEVRWSTDTFGPLTEGTAYVVVPHEFYALTGADAHPLPPQLRRTVALSTEQPGTPWFEACVARAHGMGAVLDIHASGVREWRRRGHHAVRHLPLGYVPSWDVWSGDSESFRPIDMSFMGAYNQRRAHVLAGCGEFLHRHRSTIRLVDASTPLAPGAPGMLLGRDKWSELAQTRFMVNIHRDELPYFEWHRMLGAICNGCVVVTERSADCGPLEAGAHFISARADRLPAVLEGVLDDEPRRRQIQMAAYDLIRAELPIERAADRLLEAAERVVHTPVTRWGQTMALAPTTPQLADRPFRSSRHQDRSELQVVRSGIKHLAESVRRMERSLAASDDSGSGSHLPEQLRRLQLGPIADPAEMGTPKVSVLMPVYNAAEFIEDAIDSVARSVDVEAEVILVDDGSTDESLPVILAALSARPWLAATVLSRPANRGLPAARNLALRHARGEYVFPLDSDNMVYPPALSRLAAALDADQGASFAYGILEKFDTNGAFGLESWGAWDPDRLRINNYIDAMAMIRRTAAVSVGGYVEHEALFGVEDFDMWCAFAEAGMRGTLVPEILSRYRVRPDSMISITNIDDAALWGTLFQRHPKLFAGRLG